MNEDLERELYLLNKRLDFIYTHLKKTIREIAKKHKLNLVLEEVNATE